MRLDVGKFLDDLTAKHARHYIDAINNMTAAKAVGNATEVRVQRLKLADVIRETTGTAEVMGASITLQKAAKIISGRGASLRGDRSRMIAFADTTIQTIIPHHTFEEAVESMIDRTPVTIRSAAERTGQAIRELYRAATKPIVAFVRAAEAAVTQRAPGLVAELIREGSSEVDAGARLAKDINDMRKRSRKWSSSYARMVFRTNTNTGATAGRFRQARDPDIAEVIPAFRFDAIIDGDTRTNHAAADGLTFKTSDPRWAKIAPPLGYNCRCDIIEVPAYDLKELSTRIPTGAKADEGFGQGGRPDLMLSGK